jgi:hypothetical protein
VAERSLQPGEPALLAFVAERPDVQSTRIADGWSLTFELFRVFLPKPKYAVSGPGGVEASFDWRAAFDEASGTMLRARLLNDIASYA